MKFLSLLLSIVLISSVKTDKIILENESKIRDKTIINPSNSNQNSTFNDKESQTTKLIENQNFQNMNRNNTKVIFDHLKAINILKKSTINKAAFQLLSKQTKSSIAIKNKRFLQDQNDQNNLTNNNHNHSSNTDIDNQMDKIFYEEMNFTLCGSAICYDAGGICHGIDNCECAPGYLNPKDNSIFKCTYKQYDAKIAFFLEFFVGFGTGHFYVKRYFNGMLKFCVYLFLYLFSVVIYLFFNNKRNENDQEVMVATENPYFRFARIMFMCSCFFTCIIWQISDSILFYSNFYNDGNDYPLYLYE